MEWKERVKRARTMAFNYQSILFEVRNFERDRAELRARKVNESGVRGSFTSDPTAVSALSMCDYPQHMKVKRQWISAINDAWAECNVIDRTEGSHLADIMCEWFSLSGKLKPKSASGETRDKIRRRYCLSYTKFYEIIGKITEILVYHATRRGLL